MPSDLTKADVPSFIGGNASGSNVARRAWQLMLGFVVVLFALAAAVAVSVRGIGAVNRNVGTNLALPNSLTPAGSTGGRSDGPAGWEGA